MQDLLLQVDLHKPMEPQEVQLRILEELADVISKSFLMTFKQSWESAEVPADWKLTKVVAVFKKGKKDNAVISYHQHNFIKEKSYQT